MQRPRPRMQPLSVQVARCRSPRSGDLWIAHYARGLPPARTGPPDVEGGIGHPRAPARRYRGGDVGAPAGGSRFSSPCGSVGTPPSAPFGSASRIPGRLSRALRIRSSTRPPLSAFGVTAGRRSLLAISCNSRCVRPTTKGREGRCLGSHDAVNGAQRQAGVQGAAGVGVGTPRCGEYAAKCRSWRAFSGTSTRACHECLKDHPVSLLTKD